MPRLAHGVALASCLALLALAGCRTRPSHATSAIVGPGADAPWQLQREALQTLDRYALDGRTAVAANGQGFSANLRYQQQPELSQLALDGPMGIGGMRLRFSSEGLSVTNSRIANSEWANQGEGARFQYRYVDRQLTTQPLLPWPMERRIKDEIGVSVKELIGRYRP